MKLKNQRPRPKEAVEPVKKEIMLYRVLMIVTFSVSMCSE
jgi:hypothetical protein